MGGQAVRMLPRSMRSSRPYAHVCAASSLSLSLSLFLSRSHLLTCAVGLAAVGQPYPTSRHVAGLFSCGSVRVSCRVSVVYCAVRRRRGAVAAVAAYIMAPRAHGRVHTRRTVLFIRVRRL